MNSHSKSMWDEFQILSRMREMDRIRADVRSLGRVLFPGGKLSVDYKYGEGPGHTDARGSVVLDAAVAEDQNLEPWARSDILQGVMVDEVGHNIWPPEDGITFDNVAGKIAGKVTNLEFEAVRTLLHATQNLVEDVHNVSILTRKWPGAAQLHASAVDHYLGNHEAVREAFEAEPSLGSWLGYLISAAKNEIEAEDPDIEYCRSLMSDPTEDTFKRLMIAEEITEKAIELFGAPEEEGGSGGDSPEGNEGEAPPDPGESKDKEDEEKKGVEPLEAQIENLPEEVVNGGIGKPEAADKDLEGKLKEAEEEPEYSQVGPTTIVRRKKGADQGRTRPYKNAGQAARVLAGRVKRLRHSPKRNTPGYRRGNLQRTDTWKVAARRPGPMSQKTIKSAPELTVLMVCDWSTSMADYGRHKVVLRAIDIFQRGLKRVSGVDFWAALFWGQPIPDTHPVVEFVSEPGWNDPNLMMRYPPSSNTPTLPSLEACIETVPKDKRLVVILLTDGEANRGGTENEVRDFIRESEHDIIRVLIGVKKVRADQGIRCLELPGALDNESLKRLFQLVVKVAGG